MTEQETGSQRLHAAAANLRSIVVVVALLMTFRSTVADWNDVPTPSMEPTILVGDRIAVNRLAYGLKVPFTTWHLARWADPAPGDVVVFREPVTGTRMVKRVVALPGDRVEMRRNRLLVNGAPVPLAPLPGPPPRATDFNDPPPHRFAQQWLGGRGHALMLQPARRGRPAFAAVTVPPGQFFVMGDNRDNSRDSRYFGFVPRDAILGRVFGVALSFDRDASYRPRFGRFGRGLQ